MQIKNLFKIIIIATLLAFVGGTAIIYQSFKNHQLASDKEAIIDLISSEVTKRRLVADDFLLNQSERAKSQWFVLQLKIDQLVDANIATFNTQKEKLLFDELKTTLQESRQTFEEILSAYQKGVVSPDKIARYAGQLSIKTQQTVSVTTELRELNEQKADSSLHQVMWLFSTAAVLFLLMLLAGFWTIWRSARRLEHQQAEDEAMLGSIADGVFAINKSGRIILFNHAAEILSGYKKAEAFGKPYTEILDFSNKHTGALVDDFIRTALSGKLAAMSNHTVLQKKDGDILPVADSAAPILNKQGGVEGAVIVFRDVSHEREVEHLKDEFVSIVSHELRTPMGAIRGFISMILAGYYGPVDSHLVVPLSDIKTATLRLIALVNELLDMSRIEAGRMKFDLMDFEITELLNSVVADLSPLAREHDINLHIDISDNVSVQADRNKVRQALNNLIGNALKFTDQGSITVSAKTQQEMVEVMVADTGIGIREEDQPKLFGKFEQIASVQKGRPSGSGLGLYIAREMVRKMGGELWLKHSTVGRGSVFALTLVRSHTASADRVKVSRQLEEKLNPNQK